MLIEDVYTTLVNEKLCDSAYDFSQRYLGKSKSYYSVLKSRNISPSFDVILTLESSLQNTASLYSDRQPIFTRRIKSLNCLAEDVKKHRETIIEEKLNNMLNNSGRHVK